MSITGQIKGLLACSERIDMRLCVEVQLDIQNSASPAGVVQKDGDVVSVSHVSSRNRLETSRSRLGLED